MWIIFFCVLNYTLWQSQLHLRYCFVSLRSQCSAQLSLEWKGMIPKAVSQYRGCPVTVLSDWVGGTQLSSMWKIWAMYLALSQAVWPWPFSKVTYSSSTKKWRWKKQREEERERDTHTHTTDRLRQREQQRDRESDRERERDSDREREREREREVTERESN